MLTIQGWSNDSCQQQTLALPDGTTISLTLNYVPLQYGWFIRELTYGDVKIQNMRLVTSPNILLQYRHILPFGLACFTTNGLDPSQQQDLNSGYAILYLLTEAEVDEYMELLSGTN